jgi:hypothetical protein
VVVILCHELYEGRKARWWRNVTSDCLLLPGVDEERGREEAVVDYMGLPVNGKDAGSGKATTGCLGLHIVHTVGRGATTSCGRPPQFERDGWRRGADGE